MALSSCCDLYDYGLGITFIGPDGGGRTKFGTRVEKVSMRGYIKQ